MDADADRLTLALDALIENAVDHTDTDGHIELSARREGEKIILAVADSGSGIPAAEIGRIFGRFARIDAGRAREGGGFGLGLAACPPHECKLGACSKRASGVELIREMRIFSDSRCSSS